MAEKLVELVDKLQAVDAERDKLDREYWAQVERLNNVWETLMEKMRKL
jgi:hypothetical protein